MYLCIAGFDLYRSQFFLLYLELLRQRGIFFQFYSQYVRCHWCFETHQIPTLRKDWMQTNATRYLSRRQRAKIPHKN